ncbi:ADP-ribosylglycohydrolase family protein [Butyrivibrio sp. INlla16]|uniref:ADP-ribosylglycohydrolase family protein n=1 Tax=Butyrivibrio sp. INlla16 TaxID=1520807 RepID=UPI000883C1AA|nr:ADP-ribosylglycohydrolase family protein [Butyrivibrio sp. INlla16]SDB66613.1 ADP-ribosylglycohydrolase [Butyrivibrio sp. INlla16]
MYGAFLGDMIGAPYEFDRGNKSKEFEMFNDAVEFTDDSVMTIAVCEGILNAGLDSDEKIMKAEIIKSMKDWGRRFPGAGYGAKFSWWLMLDDPNPYGSFGNGSAMRVSSVGWFYDSIERTREVARWTAEVTHNHPEGVKGAEATASAIFLARIGKSKAEIRDYIISEFGYDLSRTCDEIRPSYRHVESCQETVPEAMTAFLEGNDFEDVIRTVVSLGGDCDTLTCIAGSIAEAFYSVPYEMIKECRLRLTWEMLNVIDRFKEKALGFGDSNE